MVEPSVPIGIGLIGLGSWARSAYVPVLQELPGVTVRAVAARTEDTLGLASRLFGSEVELYTDYNRLMADPNVDAVMIGLPSKVSGQVRTGRRARPFQRIPSMASWGCGKL